MAEGLCHEGPGEVGLGAWGGTPGLTACGLGSGLAEGKGRALRWQQHPRPRV